jgi:hypothetical protein
MVFRLLDLKHPTAPASELLDERIEQCLPRPMLSLDDWRRLRARGVHLAELGGVRR